MNSGKIYFIGMVISFAILQQSAPSFAQAAEIRTWTAMTGSRIEAALLEETAEEVVLKTTAGKDITVKKAELSPADQIHLIEQAAIRKIGEDPQLTAETKEARLTLLKTSRQLFGQASGMADQTLSREFSRVGKELNAQRKKIKEDIDGLQKKIAEGMAKRKQLSGGKDPNTISWSDGLDLVEKKLARTQEEMAEADTKRKNLAREVQQKKAKAQGILVDVYKDSLPAIAAGYVVDNPDLQKRYEKAMESPDFKF